MGKKYLVAWDFSKKPSGTFYRVLADEFGTPLPRGDYELIQRSVALCRMISLRAAWPRSRGILEPKWITFKSNEAEWMITLAMKRARSSNACFVSACIVAEEKGENNEERQSGVF